MRTPDNLLGQDFTAEARIVPTDPGDLLSKQYVEFVTGSSRFGRRAFLKTAGFTALALATACNAADTPTPLPPPGRTDIPRPTATIPIIEPTATLGSPEDTEVLVTGLQWSSSNGEAVLGMGGEIPPDVLASQEVKDELGRGWIFLKSLVDQGLVSYPGVEMIQAWNNQFAENARVGWAIRLTDPALPPTGNSGYVRGALVRQGLSNEPLFIAPSGGVEQVVMAYDIEDNLQVLGLTNSGVLRKVLGQDNRWPNQELGKFDPAEVHDPLVLTQDNTDLFYNGHGGLVVASTELGYAWAIEPPTPPFVGQEIAIAYDEELKLKLTFNDKDNTPLVFDFEKNSWVKEATKPKEGFDPNRVLLMANNYNPQWVDLEKDELPESLRKWGFATVEDLKSTLWTKEQFAQQASDQLGIPNLQTSYLGTTPKIADELWSDVMVLRLLKKGVVDLELFGQKRQFEAILVQGITIDGFFVADWRLLGFISIDDFAETPCAEWNTDPRVAIAERISNLNAPYPPEPPLCSSADLAKLYADNPGDLMFVVSVSRHGIPTTIGVQANNYLLRSFENGFDPSAQPPQDKFKSFLAVRIALPSETFNQVVQSR